MFTRSKCTYVPLCAYFVCNAQWYIKIFHVNIAIKYLAEGLLISSVQTLICQEIPYSSVISFVAANNQ